MARFDSFLAIGLATAACGPSFQAVYECDVHFEHCYGLDETNAGTEAKKQCWRDWLRGYTYGQSRDRVEFASTRYSALSLGPSLPSEDPPSAAASAGPRTVAAPMPTNAFAPPPNIASAEPIAPLGSAPGRKESPPRAPGATCVEACDARWTACRDGCREPTCAHCDRAYRSCVPACFRDEPARQPARNLR